MASTKSDKHKIFPLLQFDEKQFAITLNTHSIYVGTALTLIKKHILKKGDLQSSVTSRRQYLQLFLIKCHPLIIEWLSADEGYASQLTSDSWRQKRIALAHLYACAGLSKEAKQISCVRNPVNPNDRLKCPDACKRMSSVDPKKFERLLNTLLSLGDKDSWSILIVMDALGVRPCEVGRLTIRHSDSQSNTLIVDVLSAKNTQQGIKSDHKRRGIDRVLEVKYNEQLVEAINYCTSFCTDEQSFKRWLNASRQRVGREAKKIFPNQARRFCFYTLRHQVGSLVKHVYKDDEDGARKVAAVLGHKCTKSQARYGDAATGKSVLRAKCSIKPSEETVSKVIDNRSTFIVRKSIKSLRDKAHVAEIDAILKADLPNDVRAKKLHATQKKFKAALYGGVVSKESGREPGVNGSSLDDVGRLHLARLPS